MTFLWMSRCGIQYLFIGGDAIFRVHRSKDGIARGNMGDQHETGQESYLCEKATNSHSPQA